MSYDDTVSRVVQIVEGVGAGVMVVGAAVMAAATAPAALDPARRAGAYHRLRRNLGRVILLGLEILIIGDIIRTIIVEPTLRSVLVLGLIVVIRIVLSFALEIEIDGRWGAGVPSARPLAQQPAQQVAQATAVASEDPAQQVTQTT